MADAQALIQFLQQQQAQGKTFKPLTKKLSAPAVDYASVGQAARAGMKQQAKSDWDPLWRPLEATLNALSSPLVGVENAVSKGIGTYTGNDAKKKADYNLWSTALLPIAPIAKAINPTGNYGIYGDYTDGFFASLNGDYESANYMTGHKLIEQATDDIGRLDPKYKDTQDNVNPWVKGVFGFATDVALDPLTYIPGGIIASGARGAKAAAKATSGFAKIPAAIKGVTEGAAIAGAKAGVDAAYKVGKFSNRIKPIGLDQWTQLRNYDKFEKIGRKANIGSEDLIKLADGADINEMATLLQRDPEELSRLASRVQPYVEDAKTIGLGRAIAISNKIAGPTASLINDVPIGNGATDPGILAHENDGTVIDVMKPAETPVVEPIAEKVEAPKPVNPTQYAEAADIPYGSVDAELAAKGIPGAHLRARGGLKDVAKASYDAAEFDASLGARGAQEVRDAADELNFRAANFEHLVDAVVGPDSMAKAAYHLGLPPELSLPELIFGSQKLDPTDITPDTLAGAIREIADMPFEIKGYTQPAREWIKKFDAVKADDSALYADGTITAGGYVKPKKAQEVLKNELYRRYEEGMAQIGAAGSREAFDGAIEGADGLFWREPTGQFVNIFGEVVDDPNLNLSEVVQNLAGEATKVSAGIIRKGTEALQKGAELKSANMGTYAPGTSLLGREQVSGAEKISSKQLESPNIPVELAPIYDHVAGFARVPIGSVEDWKSAIIAVANSSSSLAPTYKKVVQELRLDSPGYTKKAARKYSTYLRAFDEIADDESMGVDLLGRVFRAKESSTAGTTNVEKLSTEAKIAEKRAAAITKGAGVVSARAESRKASAAVVDAKTDAAVIEEKSKYTPEQIKAAGPNGDPVHARKTKASWLPAKAEAKATLDGSVGAKARSMVEFAKRIDGGIDGGKGPLHAALKRIMPTYRYRKGDYKVFPTAKPAPEAMERLTEAVHGRGGSAAMTDAITQLTSGLGVESLAKLRKELGGRGKSFFQLAEGTVDFDKLLVDNGRGVISPRGGIDELSLKMSNQLWRNMPGVDTLIDDIAFGLGLPRHVVSDVDTQSKIWLAIVNSLEETGAKPGRLDVKFTKEAKTAQKSVAGKRVNEPKVIPRETEGFAIGVNKTKLINALRGIEFKTGEPPRAATYTDFSNPVAGQVLEEVSLSTAKWNNVSPREVISTGREYVEYKTPMDLNRLKEVMGTAGVGPTQMEPEFARHVAQAIAQAAGPEEVRIVSKFELGSPMIADYLRAKAPLLDEMLTNSAAERIRAIEAINDYTLLDGAKLLEQSRNIDAAKELQVSRGAIDGVMETIVDKRYVGTIRQAAAAGYERSILRLTSGGKDYRVFNQRAGYTAAKVVRAAVEKSVPRGSQEFWNTYVLALRENKQLLRESGIFEVTSLSPYGGKLAGKETMDHDYAYIGFIDVMDSMLHSNPGVSPDLFRVAFDGVELDGRTFPMSVLQQAAVLSIKLDGAGLDKYAKIAALNDYMKVEIGKLDGFKAYADSIDLEVTSPTAGIVAQFANALSEPVVTSRLLERHRINGSMAVALAEKDSAALTRPHIDALTDVARNIHANTADRAKALAASIDGLRKTLLTAGFAKGSLQHAISMKMLDNHTLETFTPNELASVRTMNRQLQAAGDTAAQNVERTDVARGVIDSQAEITEAQFAREYERLVQEGASEDDLKLFTEQAMHMGRTSIENDIDHVGDIIIDAPELGKAATRAEEAAKEADAPEIRSFLDESGAARQGQRFSGRYGNADLKHLVAGKESALGNGQARTGKEIELLAKEYSEKIPVLRASEIMGRYLAANDGYGRLAVRETLTPIEQEFMDSVGARIGYLFDGSYFIRAGLDTKHYNRFVATGPLGQLENSILGDGLSGTAAMNDFKTHYGRELQSGRMTWLDFAQGTNYAMHHAMLEPILGADISARMGNKAFNITDADAKAAGWVKISGNGSLAKWMDTTQYYHPEDLKQMAVVQKALDYPAALNNKIIKVSDNITTVVKSSLTVWNPAHHIVSMLGEIFMNTLAGVKPQSYIYAMRMMGRAGDLGNPFARNKKLGINDFQGIKVNIDDLLAEGPGVPVRFFNKGNKVIPDAELYRMLDEEGITLTQNSAEDLITVNGEIAGKGNTFTQFFSPIVKANRGLGEFSARRDNVTRIAHAVEIARSRTFKDVDDMLDQIRREVFEWHPTMQMLSPFERKYARRAFFFYTWQRGAMNKIIESITERPAALMVPIKMNYEASSIGGEPEGFGHPMPNDPNLPDFMARNIMGPHWYDENGNVQSISFSAPQLDLMQQFFGAIQFDPQQDLSQNIAKNAQVVLRGNTVNQMAPVPKLGIELMTGVTMMGDTPRQIVNTGGDILPAWGQHLIDQTGLSRVSKITGMTPWGPRDDNKSADEQQTRANQLIKNTFTGLKFNEASKYADIAEQQRKAYFKQQLEELAQRLNGGQ